MTNDQLKQYFQNSIDCLKGIEKAMIDCSIDNRPATYQWDLVNVILNTTGMHRQINLMWALVYDLKHSQLRARFGVQAIAYFNLFIHNYRKDLNAYIEATGDHSITLQINEP
jgi:hypothetical protein